ncbi:MAG: hypothetical protein PHG02_09600 [Oscillospiraceae bacterium]|nr:hypothetical protein [Oscillospiraceae bacterium]
MHKIKSCLLAHPKIVKIFILVYIAFAGYFVFPLNSDKFLFDLTKVYLALAAYGIISLAFSGIYGAYKAKQVYFLTLLLTAAGVGCRCLLEAFQMNTINFNASSIVVYLLAVPIFTVALYCFLCRLVGKNK